jgi:tripartite-type tricarboxylate transporter receptor subunit TctC
LPYDTLNDFVGVARLCSQPGALVVHPSLPVQSVKDFIALAKTEPRSIFYASSGNGSGPHLWMAELIDLTGINILHVPYKGSPPAVNALVAGETQAMLASVASVIGHVRAGRLRMLGVASGKRMEMFPDIPTIAESGVPGYDMNAWVGVFAPAGTPADIIGRLNSEINKVLSMPDVQKILRNTILEAWPATPEEFAALLRSDYEKYAQLIKLTGAKSE